MAEGSTMELNALALEYKRQHGTARRDMNVSHLINNPEAGGFCRAFGLGFEEQVGNILTGELGALFDDRTNPFLVSLKRAK